MTGARAAATLERFAKTTRAFHWTFAASFLTLAATGGALALRESLALDERGLLSLRALVAVHKTAAVLLFAAPSLVLLSGETRVALRDLLEPLRWSRSDFDWLARQLPALLGRAALPPAGKLNAGQKLNSLVTAALSVLLAASGTLLWLRPGSLAAWFAHLALFLAWIPLFLGHLSLALVVPGTRPALRGMLLGRVDRSWAEHHHPLWADGSRARREPVDADAGSRTAGGG